MGCGQSTGGKDHDDDAGGGAPTTSSSANHPAEGADGSPPAAAKPYIRPLPIDEEEELVRAVSRGDAETYRKILSTMSGDSETRANLMMCARHGTTGEGLLHIAAKNGDSIALVTLLGLDSDFGPTVESLGGDSPGISPRSRMPMQKYESSTTSQFHPSVSSAMHGPRRKSVGATAFDGSSGENSPSYSHNATGGGHAAGGGPGGVGRGSKNGSSSMDAAPPTATPSELPSVCDVDELETVDIANSGGGATMGSPSDKSASSPKSHELTSYHHAPLHRGGHFTSSSMAGAGGGGSSSTGGGANSMTDGGPPSQHDTTQTPVNPHHPQRSNPSPSTNGGGPSPGGNGGAAVGGSITLPAHVLNAKTSTGHTPLHLACIHRAGDFDGSVGALIFAGADLTCVNISGDTLLHSLVKGGGYYKTFDGKHVSEPLVLPVLVLAEQLVHPKYDMVEAKNSKGLTPKDCLEEWIAANVKKLPASVVTAEDALPSRLLRLFERDSVTAFNPMD